MTIKVKRNSESEARLAAEARPRGLPPEKVAEQLLKEALARHSLSPGRMGIEEFHRMLDAMADGSEKLPEVRTESLSRESFYQERLDGGNAVPRR
jgi:hypothetical protein